MQAYPAYGQNKGTLMPGQAISVGKYNVQVERYLSQGGFAHVYLVRTAQPVYNTTHHVLKRIAVQNEAMLTEVKKEVDIMRLLKGHPNIHGTRFQTGVFEVFILMEFCPGGGIIDMMNRRLRERLTEAEILQIFVRCPALLHRDLKVENILQASPTSFKLCDFGSANNRLLEIRVLEADLNRHTTLQYRAPEMVDPYLRRPVDEKSDVWALGVLLYKLCYYTTPFEEHGPLAILNVQYRIPPYPVYSSHMNGLIASMLREHGAHRPTVFELLNQSQQPDQSVISYKAGQQMAAATAAAKLAPVSSSSTKNNGVQARDKVLEAIAPMRRGRPGASDQAPLHASHSDIQPEKPRNWLDEEEKAWKAVTSQPKDVTTSIRKSEDAWAVKDPRPTVSTGKKEDGFGDDFAEKLWINHDSQSQNTLAPPLTKPERLPVSERERPQTLGETRALRTGLASTGNTTFSDQTTRISPSPQPAYISARASPQPPSQSYTSSKSPAPNPSYTGEAHDDSSAETRFPSLEELDQTIKPKPDALSSNPGPHLSASLTSHPLRRRSANLDGSFELRPPLASNPSHTDGVRSQQVTGIAMKDYRSYQTPAAPQDSQQPKESSLESSTPAGITSVAMNSQMASSVVDDSAPRLPPRPPKDWLTGNDEAFSPPPAAPPKSQTDEGPRMRASPSKRASYIPHPLSVEHDVADVLPDPVLDPPPSALSRATHVFPDLDMGSLELSSSKFGGSESSADEGPEDVQGILSSTPKRKGRQSSVHDLVDLWGGGPESKLKKDSPTKPAPLDVNKDRSSFISPPAKTPPTFSASNLPSTGMSDRRTPTSSSSIPSPDSASSRSRPHKIASESSKDSTSSLDPPESPSKQRTARRTSISDMVQKYEAIGAIRPRTTVGSGTASPVTTSFPLRQAADDAKPVTELGTTSSRLLHHPSLPVSTESRFGPVKVPISNPSSSGLPRSSPMPLPVATSTGEQQVSKPEFGIRQDSMASVNSAKSSDSTRSSSPERPYQGVGKLIDQWQRKAVEEQPRTGAVGSGVSGL
ncbi:hypothetical protein DL96DRAFT_1574847 [Flagelloscypha sp. PMI_526]|nr:hypothetical protein DL96DRAFT_1574847 [Flagelloscypha sp. PMI_526]